MKKTLVLFAMAAFLVPSCYYDNAEELYGNQIPACDVSAVTYSQDVSAIVAQNCAYSGCHLNPNAQAGLDFSTHATVQANSAAIKDRINRPAGAVGAMPPSGPMSACNIEKVTTWIDQGALNN